MHHHAGRHDSVTGVLEIGHRSGLVDQLAGRMGPILTSFSKAGPGRRGKEADKRQYDCQHTGTGVGRHAGQA